MGIYYKKNFKNRLWVRQAVAINLFTKNIFHNFGICFILVLKISFDIDVSNSHGFVHMIKSCMNSVLVNLAFVEGYGCP